MKVAFLCNSIEPGRDGVGDYTRRIASELINQNYTVHIIALNDQFIINEVVDNENINSNVLHILRLPSIWPIKKRIEGAKKYMEYLDIDYISLQFVIYGYHSKGLPFGLGKQLASLIQNKPWQIMFHEIWTGITQRSPIIHKIYGYLQRKIIKNILRLAKPNVITTSNKLYQCVLEDYGINNTILPLFSNIEVTKAPNDYTKTITAQLGHVNKTDYLLIGIFGTLYSNANLEKAIEQQFVEATSKSKKLVFVSVGKVGSEGVEEIDKLKKIFYNKVDFHILGELSEYQVSTVLQLMDIGISCTPFQHLGKSGVFAALRLHNLKVLTPVNDHIPEYDTQIKEYNEYLLIKEPYKWSVKYAVKNYTNIFKYQ